MENQNCELYLCSKDKNNNYFPICKLNGQQIDNNINEIDNNYENIKSDKLFNFLNNNCSIILNDDEKGGSIKFKNIEELVEHLNHKDILENNIIDNKIIRNNTINLKKKDQTENLENEIGGKIENLNYNYNNENFQSLTIDDFNDFYLNKLEKIKLIE